MDPFWQYVIIGAVLTGAVGYLGWYFGRKAFRKKTPCGTCGLMKLVEKRGNAEVLR